MPLSPVFAAAAAHLAAQCTGAEESCDLPRSLPWLLAIAGLAVWGVLLVGLFVVARHRRRLRTERRRERSRRRPGDPRLDLEPY